MGRRRRATSRCGSRRATSRSSTPVTDDMTQTMLVRMGIVRRRRQAAHAGRGSPQRGGAAPVPRHRPLARDDGAPHGRPALHRGVGVPHVRVGRGSARRHAISSPATATRPRLVSYVRADETPHVDYLRTALTEMRDRTFVGESGAKIAGTEVIGTIWDAALELSLGANREGFVRQAMGEVEHALAAHPRRDDVLEGFVALGAGVEVSGVKFGIFYEHQLPRPWDGRLRVPPDPGRARADRVRRLASASTTRGRSSTTSSRSTRTRARPRCSSRPRRNARRASASGTASCRPRRRSTIPRASPSASRCSTS